MENPTEVVKPAETKVITNSTNVLKRPIVRQLIVSTREVNVQGVDKVVLTTENGIELWANAKQVSKDAEEVRFRYVKEGDTYVYNKEERQVKNDGAWFVGTGKAYVDPTAKASAILEKMAELGMTNAINL